MTALRFNASLHLSNGFLAASAGRRKPAIASTHWRRERQMPSRRRRLRAAACASRRTEAHGVRVSSRTFASPQPFHAAHPPRAPLHGAQIPHPRPWRLRNANDPQRQHDHRVPRQAVRSRRRRVGPVRGPGQSLPHIPVRDGRRHDDRCRHSRQCRPLDQPFVRAELRNLRGRRRAHIHPGAAHDPAGRGTDVRLSPQLRRQAHQARTRASSPSGCRRSTTKAPAQDAERASPCSTISSASPARASRT